jgi:glutaredoxin
MIGARPFAAALPAILAAVFTMVFTFCAASAQAQQLYRWTDEKGAVHITDTPPPASAKDVQKPKAAASAPATAQEPFELTQAMKDFPVTLYTAPNCKEPCARARSALNRRGVPFKEVQVWDMESNQELKRVSGSAEVPVLVVGRSVQKGYEQGAFDALLDSARYPRAGVLPARNQPAPKPPEDVAASQRPADAPKAEEEPKPAGPYAPRFSK